MENRLRITGIVLIILLTGTGISAQKPNIILIISDDQSLNSIGYAGCQKWPHPAWSDGV